MSQRQRNFYRGTWFAAGVIVGGALLNGLSSANAGDRNPRIPADARQQRIEMINELKQLNATTRQLSESVRGIQTEMGKLQIDIAKRDDHR